MSRSNSLLVPNSPRKPRSADNLVTRNFHKLILAALALTLSTSALANGAGSTPLVNFWGSYSAPTHKDPSKPQDVGKGGRSYLTTDVQASSNGRGIEVGVDLWDGKLNDPVSLFLQVAINDGHGKLEPVTILTLSDKVKDNPTNFHSRRVFKLSYAKINAELKKLLPPGAQQIKVGPGSPILVLGEWTDYKHHWGGLARGGIAYIPERAGQSSAQTGQASRATDLDIGYEIRPQMAAKYNTTDAAGKAVGLKEGGQIKSRLEAEGKYQVPIEDAPKMTKKLFAMSNDPKIAKKILGEDWTIEAKMRYMKKDPKNSSKFMLDSNGLPIPDPMVDTYYDSADNKGAQSDIAIRYRWTEGNGEGAWNFKPGLTAKSADGVVRRLEYAVETTDDKPETVKAFADSMDPLNPFKIIRDISPGSTPSDFLKPSLRITDKRYKFLLKHKTGVEIEISVDNVLAESMRLAGHRTEYVQIEMDVDHPAAQTANVAKGVNSWTPQFGVGTALASTLTPELEQFVSGLDEKAFIDGRPVIHTIADLDPKSPLSMKIAPELQIAEDVIKVVRDHVIGKNWVAAPQKASLASVLLEHIDKKDASPSVKEMITRVKGLSANAKKPGTFYRDAAPGKSCRMVFQQIHN